VVLSYRFVPSWNSPTINAERNFRESYLRDFIPDVSQVANLYQLVELNSIFLVLPFVTSLRFMVHPPSIDLHIR
jgi:hypothetical protein